MNSEPRGVRDSVFNGRICPSFSAAKGWMGTRFPFTNGLLIPTRETPSDSGPAGARVEIFSSQKPMFTPPPVLVRRRPQLHRVNRLRPLDHHTPSLPDARPRSDRFRRGGRESKFLQRRSHAPAARHAVLKICVVPPRKPLFSGDRFRKWPLSSALSHHGLSNLLRVCVAERVSSSSPLSCLPRLFSSPRRASWPLRASWPRRPSSWPLRLPSF